uniref:Uncharacterized protein n=1 Tax=viral metagenome TaxID=1070528 RepID=A0A6C0K263_9ZZZZ
MSLPNCYQLAINCNFPTTVAEVYGLAALEAAEASALSNVNVQYQNAFCTPSTTYCFDPCPPLPQDLTDTCNFQCVYKKYGTGCATDCCNGVSQCTASGSSSTYSNPVIKALENFYNTAYPAAVAAANAASTHSCV